MLLNHKRSQDYPRGLHIFPEKVDDLSSVVVLNTQATIQSLLNYPLSPFNSPPLSKNLLANLTSYSPWRGALTTYPYSVALNYVQIFFSALWGVPTVPTPTAPPSYAYVLNVLNCRYYHDVVVLGLHRVPVATEIFISFQFIYQSNK